MKLSIFCPFGLKTPVHALKLGFVGYFTHKMGSNINKIPKGTSASRNGSKGVLSMSVSSIVPEKLRGNKKCDEEELAEEEEEEEELRHILAVLASL